MSADWRAVAIAIRLTGFGADKRNKPRVEMAPLLDIIFILLIFFAVSSTLIVQRKGIDLQLPAAASVAQEKKGVVVSIDQSHRFFLDGKPISNEELRKEIAAQSQDNEKLQVILNADRNTPYNLVIYALDEIRMGGVFDIVLQAKKKSS